MMTVAEWKRALNAGKLDEKLKQLYGSDAAVMAHQKKRYTEALEEFAKLYPERKQVSIFSAPGRTEVRQPHRSPARLCPCGGSQSGCDRRSGIPQRKDHPAEIHRLCGDSGASV